MTTPGAPAGQAARAAPTTLVRGQLERAWTDAAGEEGGVLRLPSGERWRFHGRLPPARPGHHIQGERQGDHLQHARRLVTEHEIAHAFYGRLSGHARQGALKITRTLGEHTHHAITTRLSSLQGIRGIPESGLRAMRAHADRHGHHYAALRQLADLGLPPEHAHALLDRYGSAAPEALTRNPYELVAHHVPLRVADHVAALAGLSSFDPRRGPALALDLTRHAAREFGHTALPRATLTGQLRDDHALDEDEAEQAVQDALNAKWLTECGGMIATPALLAIERRLASDLARLLGAPSPPRLPDVPAPHLSPEQARAVDLAARERVSLITGGPGTGKTTTLSALLARLDAARVPVHLCAPTGKAAARMQQSTGREATTLHQLLGYDSESFTNTDVLHGAVVIDECSMCSNELLWALCRVLGNDARLILVGDEDQLPPIDPGHPLAQLLGRIPTARLTQTHRQAQGSPILKLARQLVSGEAPQGTGVPFQKTPDTGSVVQLAQSQATEAGVPVILTAGRAGPFGTRALNAAMQAALNPGAGRLRVGDPVITTRNNHDTGLMNGETGRVVAIGTEDDPGEVVTAFGEREFVFSSFETGTLDLAYAITIHRSQGSEWPGVIALLSLTHERLLTRQLAYTAVTRAKERLTACGDRAAWVECALTPARARHSLLGTLLRTT